MEGVFMKKNGKLLLFSERVRLEKILLGSLWTASGVSSLFNSTLGLILQILSLTTIVYTLVRVSFAKAESADEMAEQNMNKAKAVASDYMLMLFCCIAIIAILFLRNITLAISLNQLIPAVVLFVMGCHSVITGLAFRKFEDD